MAKPEEKAEEVGDLYESYKTASMFVENTYISEHERSIVTQTPSSGLQIYSHCRSGPPRHFAVRLPTHPYAAARMCISLALVYDELAEPP